MPLCIALNANGEPCGAYAMEGSDYCFFHSPKVNENRSTSLDLSKGHVTRKRGFSYERLFGKGIRETPRVDKLSEFEKTYDEGGIIARAIDSYVNVAVANGYQLIDSKTGERETKETTIIDELDQRVDFYLSLEKAMRSCLIYGYAWGEMDIKGNKIEKLIFYNPAELRLERSDSGEIIKAYQVKGGKDTAEWSGETLKNIFYIPFNVKHSEPYGKGLIERIYDQYKEQKTQGEHLDAVTKYVAYPFRVVKVGSDKYPASDAYVDIVAEEMDQLEPGDLLATKHNIEFEFHSPKAPEALTDVYKEKTRLLIVALGVPSLYTALSDIDAQTLKEIRNIFNSTVRSLQMTVSTDFEDQIIKRQFEIRGERKKRTDISPVKIAWNPLTVSVLSILELTQLVAGGVVSLDEARRIIESMGYGLLRGDKWKEETALPNIKQQNPKQTYPTKDNPDKVPIKTPPSDIDRQPSKTPQQQPKIKRPQPNEPKMTIDHWMEGIQILKEIDKRKAYEMLVEKLGEGFDIEVKEVADT